MSAEKQNLSYPTLAIWTRKFAQPLSRLIGTTLQKMIASDQGAVVLNVYKPGDDRSVILLSIKKGESGIWKSHTKPSTQSKPNSFVQISRKYLLGRKIKYAYALISPISVVIEFEEPFFKNSQDEKELHAGPNALILDLDAKPPRVVLCKKYSCVPERYQKETKDFENSMNFFESWCEWSEEITKTKKRALFTYHTISYCPVHFESDELKNKNNNQNNKLIIDKFEQEEHNNRVTKKNMREITINSALEILPSHIRKFTKTRLQFYVRRLSRQKNDLPSEIEIEHLERKSEGLKANLYLWPQNSLVWYVPPEIIQQYGLPAFISLEKQQKPGDLISKTYKDIEILKRRRKELLMRIENSIREEEIFHKLLFNTAQDLFEQTTADSAYKPAESLIALCKFLKIPVEKNIKQGSQQKGQEGKLPYKIFYASTGEQIRLARSALEGDQMLKLMPA
ncbi:MAG: hypothetical protein K2X39_01825, partial [Silvanigrellaceae bacterium]|nr:hypothetical protein [Silvanigrellaceae bacterium]